MSTPSDPLAFNYLPIGGGGKPSLPIRLKTAAPHETVVTASLAPSLPRTVLAPLWAEAIGLSPGGAVQAQISTAMSLTAPSWGPPVIIAPILAEELDEISAAYAELEDESVDWRERDICLLGNDFLSHITVVLDGINGRLVVDTASWLS